MLDALLSSSSLFPITHVVFAAAAINAFAYVVSLLNLTRYTAQRSATGRRLGVVAGIAAAHFAWRSGLLIPVVLVCTALLVGSPVREVLRPGTVGVRLLVATMCVTALSLVSPPIYMHANSATELRLQLQEHATFGATVRIASLQPVAFDGPLLLKHDRAHVEPPTRISVAATGGDPAVVVFGNDVSVSHVDVHGALLSVGRRLRLSNVTIQCTDEPCLVVRSDSVLEHVTLNGVPLASHCLASPAVWCTDDPVAVTKLLGDVRQPLWTAVEAYMPGLVARLDEAARVSAAVLFRTGRFAARHGLVALSVATEYVVWFAHVAHRAGGDVWCAMAAGASRDDRRSCPRNYPWLHEAAFQLAVVVWAVGVPTAWAAICWGVEVELQQVRFLTSALISAAASVAGPAGAAGIGAAGTIADTAAALLPVAAFGIVDAYAAYVSLFWTIENSVLSLLRWTVAALASGVFVTLGPLLTVVTTFWRLYTTTTFPSHISVATLQTALVAVSYVKEVRVQAAARRTATTGVMGRLYNNMTWTGAVTQVVAQEAAGLAQYAAVHVAGALVVAGASFLAIIPLLHSAALHLAFPLASSWAALALFNRQSRAAMLAVFAARAVLTLLFQWSIGDMVYLFVSEVLKPLLLLGAALAVAVVGLKVGTWRRNRPAVRQPAPNAAAIKED
jgi:hypothetical protein